MGCSTNTEPASGASTTNTISQLTATLNSKISGVAGILDAASSLIESNNPINSINSINSKAVIRPFASFSTAWTTTSPGIDNPVTNGAPDPISFKDFMGQQLNANLLSDGGAAINAFGRMNQAFQIFCAVGVGSASAGYAIDSQGYLANGTYQITFTSTVKTSMTSTCGINTSSIPDNTVMTMTVETGGANYDKKLTFDAFDQSYWVKNNTTVLRVATAENTSNGYSRTIAEYNKTTGVTRAQAVYTNAPAQSGSVELFRIYYDETSDVGMVFGYRGNDAAVTNATRYLLSGKPTAGDALSLSLRADTPFSSTDSYEACVLSASGNITTDGSRCSATSTRLVGADVSTANASVTTFYSAYAGQAASSNWGPAGLTDSDVIPFTDMTDLATTAYAP